ncbi:MAG: hypothetical protein Q9225_000818 [Loekoesia sp. 1 TL-2023]
MGVEPLREWINEVPNNGLLLYHDFMNWERVFLTKPEALTEVLVTRVDEFVKPPHFVQGLGKVFGTGLLFSEGRRHKEHRKQFEPVFSYQHIKDMYQIFWKKAERLTQEIDRENRARAPTRAFLISNFGEWASRTALDILGSAGLGFEFRTLSDPDQELSWTYQKACQPSKTAIFAGILGFSGPTRALGNVAMKFTDDFATARGAAERHCNSLINDRKKYFLTASTEPKLDILTTALRSGTMSNDDLTNHLMTFLLAGHDTVAASFSWALYYLCKHPEIQMRLRQALKSCLPQARDPSWRPSAAEIDQIDYLHAVCNEVLRLRPPVQLSQRVANVDTSILGQVIPKGTVIILCPLAVNRSRELWSHDADEFKPERWMGPANSRLGGAESPYAFLTFLFGRRGCIGKTFAKAELACLLAVWVNSFETELTDIGHEAKVKNGIAAKPAELPLKVRRIPE